MGKIKLFTLPYAGASASVYLKLKKYFSKHVDLHPIELTGRGTRYNEPLNDSLINTAKDCFDQIKEFLNQRYAVYAHSMGCTIAYELIKMIKNNNYQEPVHILLSGGVPPHLPCKCSVANYSDQDLIEEIKEMGGTPDAILENKELLEIFLPIIKSDYRKIEQYQYTGVKEKFNNDITFLFADADHYVSREEVEQWSHYTNKLVSRKFT